MNNPEKFATSLVSLALVRSGYATSKEVRRGGEIRADILAVSENNDTEAETFVVEVKAIRDRHSIPERLDVLRERYRSVFGVTVYLAFFVDSDDLLIVDDELRKRMRFSDEEIRLEAIPRKVLASGFPHV